MTRLEEKSQNRQCGRLRGALQNLFISLPVSYYKAFEETKALAVEADLEKYYDMYEISLSDMLDAEEIKDGETAAPSEDTLKALKVGSQKLHLTRKLFLCSLLALSADGGKVDFAKWSTATRVMDDLTIQSSKATQDLDEILGAEEGKKRKFEILRRRLLSNFHRSSNPCYPKDALDSWKRADPMPGSKTYIAVSRHTGASGKAAFATRGCRQTCRQLIALVCHHGRSL